MTTSARHATGRYVGVREYLGDLDRRDLLVRVDRGINKDTEIMPLVRWQFRGLDESPARYLA